MNFIQIEQIPYPSALVNNELKLVTANKKFFSFFGHPDSLPKPISNFIRNPYFIESLRITANKTTENKIIEELECRSDRKKRTFEIHILPDSDSTKPIFISFLDISQMINADKRRIDFVANVSHELRTPLTAILGFTEILDNELSNNSEHRNYLSIIKRHSKRLLDLATDLLELSRLESDEAQEDSSCQKEWIDTQSLTEEAFTNLMTEATGKSQTLKSHISASQVLGERKRILQVMINLIHNAIQYCPEESTIEVTWQNNPKSSNLIELTIKDNGPGISKSHQERIFERFYRVESSRNRNQGGTGLGLAIVKHIMIQHGGKIDIQSTPGLGTEFRCQFPNS